MRVSGNRVRNNCPVLNNNKGKHLKYYAICTCGASTDGVIKVTLRNSMSVNYIENNNKNKENRPNINDDNSSSNNSIQKVDRI